MKNLKIFLIAFVLLIPAGLVKAECALSFKNLSIANQTNSDTANIIRLQTLMLVNDLYSGPVTGYYGKLTEKSIKTLEADNGLVVDGTIDKEVVNILCDNYSDCPFQSTLEKNDEFPVTEIKALQYFLRLIPNIYPEKLVTGFYGGKTESAVKRLQTKIGITGSGKMDSQTRQEFCNAFNDLDSDTINTKSETTSSIFQTLCLAFPQSVETGQSVTFISQILGGASPYKYIWNNKTDNSDKTVKMTYSKAGTYTVNLKVIDTKGQIATANCNITVTGKTIAGSDLNLDVDFNKEPDLNVNIGNTSVSSSTTTITTKTTVGKIGSSFDQKTFYQPVEKYINNPVKVDAEVLPVEIVRGDPIKINIINLPGDLKRALLYQ
jgi:peptidoglycan hydrolase-like protein with peptidoglycan-binding domain